MAGKPDPTFEDIRRDHRRRNDAIEDRAELIDALRDELLAQADIAEYYQRDLELAKLWRRRANSEQFRALLADKRLSERAFDRACAYGGPFGFTFEVAARRQTERDRRDRAFAAAIPGMIDAMVGKRR